MQAERMMAMRAYLFFGQLIVRIVLALIAVRRYGKNNKDIKELIGLLFALSGGIMDVWILPVDIGPTIFIITYGIVWPLAKRIRKVCKEGVPYLVVIRDETKK